MIPETCPRCGSYEVRPHILVMWFCVECGLTGVTGDE